MKQPVEWRVIAGGKASREEQAARLVLAGLPGVGPVAYSRLLDRYGGAGVALAAGPENWRTLSLPQTIARLEREEELAGWGQFQAEWDAAQAVLHRAERLGCTVVTWGEADYPPLLGRCPDPPRVLFVRGQLLAEDWRSIAVVGTRVASAYGRWQAERLAGELVAEGFTVVSGLARGVDAAAHWGALRSGGRTVAVLGCGPERIYPPENAALGAEIMQHGAIVTEFPPGTMPNPDNFPRRNRIIAGLSLGTVVVEAGLRSGALNTARHAREANREVFAVPGEAGRPRSAGCHALIRGGATLFEHGRQVVEELPYLADRSLQLGQFKRLGPIGGGDWRGEGRGQEGTSEQPTTDLGRLWNALKEGAGRTESLAAQSGLPVGAVAAQLVLWELEGKVRAYPDGRVIAND